MRVIRSSKNHKLMIELESEAERQVFVTGMNRALNTWPPVPPPMMLQMFDLIQPPLVTCTQPQLIGGHAPRFDPIKFGIMPWGVKVE